MNTLEPLIFDSSGSYRTKPLSIPALCRFFPSLTFYYSLVESILKASAIAKQGAYSREEWQKTSLIFLRALERSGLEIEITGVGNLIDLEGPCVIIGNHMSTLETGALPVIIDPLKTITFIVKESLINYPVFGHVMRATNPITVTRTNPRDDLKKVLTEGVEKLRTGTSIVVFPQTTRSDTFDPAQFNSIGIKLAKNGCVPVIPLALKTDAWPNGKLIKDFGVLNRDKRVYFSFGEPIYITDRGNEAHSRVISFIQDMLTKWDSLTVKGKSKG